MKCEEFEKVVITLARNKLTESSIREQSLGHAKACRRCGIRLRDEQVLLSGISAVVAEIDRRGASSHVETALLTAFRAQKSGAAYPGVAQLANRSSRWSSWKLAAMAAGILILISVTYVIWRSANTPSPGPQRAVVVPTPPRDAPPLALTAQGPGVASPDGYRLLAQLENKPKRARRKPPTHDPAEDEVVTQFFALREGEDLAALESLRLVRIELPGSALSEVGLQVNPETANSPVQADVLLGQDGLARAIRFVR